MKNVNTTKLYVRKPKELNGYIIESYYCECGCKKTYYRYVKKEWEQATKLFEKHWTQTTGKPLDEMTKQHMNYAIEAIHEALNKPIDISIKMNRYLILYTSDKKDEVLTVIFEKESIIQAIIDFEDTYCNRTILQITLFH